MFKQYKYLSKEVYIICLSKFVSTLGAFIWPLFVIILRSKLFFSEGKVTMFLVIATGLGIISGITGGIISDKFGRKRTIMIFELLGILSFLMIVFFPIGIQTAYFLLMGMVFFGISWPAHDALLANITKTEERESAYSLSYLAINLGIIVGPALGGLLIKDHFNLFIIIDVITSFIGWSLLMLLVKEPAEDAEIDNEFEEKREGSILKIFVERPIIFFYGILLLFTSAVYGQLDITLPLYIESLFDNFERIFGFLYSWNGLVVVIFTPLITIVLSKKTSMQKVKYGLMLYAIVTFSYVITSNVIGLFLLMAIFTIGEVLITVGISPIMSKIVPANMMARASSLIAVFYTVGHLIAMLVPGLMLENGASFPLVWFVLGCIAVLAYVYFYFFNRTFKDILGAVDKFDRNRK
jgi:Na+/melibiose symporter-like transporter